MFVYYRYRYCSSPGSDREKFRKILHVLILGRDHIE